MTLIVKGFIIFMLFVIGLIILGLAIALLSEGGWELITGILALIIFGCIVLIEIKIIPEFIALIKA